MPPSLHTRAQEVSFTRQHKSRMSQLPLKAGPQHVCQAPLGGGHDAQRLFGRVSQSAHEHATQTKHGDSHSALHGMSWTGAHWWRWAQQPGGPGCQTRPPAVGCTAPAPCTAPWAGAAPQRASGSASQKLRTQTGRAAKACMSALSAFTPSSATPIVAPRHSSAQQRPAASDKPYGQQQLPFEVTSNGRHHARGAR